MLLMTGDLLNEDFINSNAENLKTYLQQESINWTSPEDETVVGLEGQIIDNE